ncbi:hypothetical protein BOTBODRAFT_114546 [Botryobasidium botryosum FD-172 SS1]|uniref:CcmS related domain-containing protein n=1 Tax=Botryobasidium botryosum (strain FD-172 SS1) TaxID=930990 RepID=A0A067M9G9_BOTB1|nr:hypothetical protein BOTBODRAFT_114546 [Botryobasidium botryosum FD-172 SS1]
MDRAERGDVGVPPGDPYSFKLVDSGGMALNGADRAFWGHGSVRPASSRLIWILPPAYDERVRTLLKWIEEMSWPIAGVGVKKFLKTRERGAFISNADFRPRFHPTEPAFDWITFKQAQLTKDRTLQESIATYDPATTTLVFVFLLSKSGNSAGIWRTQLLVPASLQVKYHFAVDKVKASIGHGRYRLKLEYVSSTKTKNH